MCIRLLVVSSLQLVFHNFLSILRGCLCNVQALSRIVQYSHYDFGLLLEFEFINGRCEASSSVNRILENDMDFQSIMQLVEQASGI